MLNGLGRNEQGGGYLGIGGSLGGELGDSELLGAQLHRAHRRRRPPLAWSSALACEPRRIAPQASHSPTARPRAGGQLQLDCCGGGSARRRPKPEPDVVAGRRPPAARQPGRADAPPHRGPPRPRQSPPSRWPPPTGASGRASSTTPALGGWCRTGGALDGRRPVEGHT